MSDAMKTSRRTVTEDDRLVWVVRGMAPGEFTRRFRDGLPAAALVQLVAALPRERLDELVKRADRPGAAAPSRRPRSREGGTDRPLATAIRMARKEADLSQGKLAERLGVRQSSVSQWERGTTEPAGQRLLDLMRELSGLADALKSAASLRVVSGRLDADPSTDPLSGEP
jgi:DNA-binding XRE family transcriptional regulator